MLRRVASRLRILHWAKTIQAHREKEPVSGSSNCMTISVEAEPGKILSTGRYEAQLAQENGSWKFARRLVIGDVSNKH